MFSYTKNPYQEPVAKATDEKQTSEDWSSLLTIWEKVNAEGEAGARNVIAAIVQRLQHRNANVQLYSLTLANALVKNCGKYLHHEVAGKTFTDTLKRLILDRNTHEKVKQRIAGLIKEWTADFSKDESLGIMGETYDFLKAKGVRFEEPRDEGPPPIPDAVLKREEEDLQRAIAESEREAKQRNFGSSGYQPAAGPSGTTSQKPLPALDNASNGPYPSLQQQPAQAVAGPAAQDAQANAPKRVRALFDFDPDPDQPGELPLRRGDVIKIIDAAYQEWWRGELRGRVGIFPVTYVEVIPEPTPDMGMAEAEYEANVFSQAGEVDRLLRMLQSIDPNTENIGDNDELSDLYQKCLMLRPRVLKLVEKYTAKKNELLDINNRFMSAKTDYEARLEESWRQHHAAQQQQINAYAQPPPAQPQPAYQGYAPQQSQPAAPPQRQGSYYAAQPPAPPEQPYPAQSAYSAQAAPAPAEAAPPQPFYDHATNQWFYPPGYAPEGAAAVPQQQSPPPQVQQYQRPVDAAQSVYQQPQAGYTTAYAPPTQHFGAMHLGAQQQLPAQ